VKRKTQSTATLRNINEVGLALERLRKQKGLSQTELAKKIGVRQGTISDLERKVKIPTLKTFFSILLMRAIDSQHYCGLKYTTGAIFFKSYVDQSSHLLIISTNLT
jgi:HTH-type transcriptional regulator/antitoxin HipB